jgi:hypothetical protein
VGFWQRWGSRSAGVPGLADPRPPRPRPCLQSGEAVECGLLALRVSLARAPPAANGGSASTAGGSSGGKDIPAAGGGGGPRRVRVELAAAATAPSFGVAYQGPGMAAPEATMLRRPGHAGGARDGCGGGLAPGVTALEFCCAWDAPAGGGGPVA